jgi:hypothetical protein
LTFLIVLGKTLTLPEQRAFSEVHKLNDKLKAAETEWAPRGYSDVNLPRLNGRMGLSFCLAARPIGGKFLRTKLNPPREVWKITLGICIETATFLV